MTDENRTREALTGPQGSQPCATNQQLPLPQFPPKDSNPHPADPKSTVLACYTMGEWSESQDATPDPPRPYAGCAHLHHLPMVGGRCTDACRSSAILGQPTHAWVPIPASAASQIYSVIKLSSLDSNQDEQGQNLSCCRYITGEWIQLWCAPWDSNPHALRQEGLGLPRLPITPGTHMLYCSRVPGNRTRPMSWPQTRRPSLRPAPVMSCYPNPAESP